MTPRSRRPAILPGATLGDGWVLAVFAGLLSVASARWPRRRLHCLAEVDARATRQVFPTLAVGRNGRDNPGPPPMPIPPMTLPACSAPRLLLAPMEGMLDSRLREVITQVGTYDWCVTEFVRVTNQRLPSRCFMRAAPELGHGARTLAGTPVRVQLLGSDPGCLAANAAFLAGLKPAGIDLNFGCPAPQVNRHRGGAVLLNEPELLHAIAREVSAAIAGRVPFTAKMRLGVSDTSKALEAAQSLAEGGAQLLVVHARTKADGYRPPAYWEWVGRVAEAVQVPVVANGEIWTLQDYLRCRAQSGRADVMLGRGALADPFLAQRIRDHLAGATLRPSSGDWPQIVPLLMAYWQAVRRELEPRHAPGRLKQWLNLLQRNYLPAAALFRQIRALADASEIDAHLAAVVRDHAIAPPG